MATHLGTAFLEGIYAAQELTHPGQQNQAILSCRIATAGGKYARVGSAHAIRHKHLVEGVPIPGRPAGIGAHRRARPGEGASVIALVQLKPDLPAPAPAASDGPEKTPLAVLLERIKEEVNTRSPASAACIGWSCRASLSRGPLRRRSSGSCTRAGRALKARAVDRPARLHHPVRRISSSEEVGMSALASIVAERSCCAYGSSRR
jgi:hypothetical protein